METPAGRPDAGQINGVPWVLSAGSPLDIALRRNTKDPALFSAAQTSPKSGRSESPPLGRRKDTLLAVVCSELRAPIVCARHAMRLLADPCTNVSDRARLHAVLDHQLDQMFRLIEDLLGVSKMANGHATLQCQQIDLRMVLRHVLETQAQDIVARGHHLTISMPDFPVWLMADADRLEQVFVNLLANAAKYTDPGGRLAIWLTVQGKNAVVQVRDSGIGIAPDVLPHIFELFGQANHADSRSRCGLGIGLTVVHNFVALHGGSVSAASRGVGHGSEFTVFLPHAL